MPPRGWAHIGVLKALKDAGIKPDILCVAFRAYGTDIVVILLYRDGALLRKTAARTVNDLWEAIAQSIEAFNPEESL